MRDLKKFKINLLVSLIVINFVVTVMVYFTMPIIQSFPPFGEELDFQKKVEGITHIQQYVYIFLAMSVLHIISLRIYLKRIIGFLKKYYFKQIIDREYIEQVRKDCINVPYKYYLMQLAIVLSIGVFVILIFVNDWLPMFKGFMMVYAITSLIELIQFMYLQSKLRQVMLLTYEVDENYERNIGYRIKFSNNLIVQIIPFLSVSIIIMALLGYASTIEEKGNASATYYMAYLDSNRINYVTMESIKETLDKIPLKTKDDFYFIIPPNRNEIYVSQQGRELTDFFLLYMDTFFEKTDGRIYEFFGTDQQAYAKKIMDLQGREWYIGFEYWTKDYELMVYYILLILGILCMYILLIYIWSDNATKNVVRVSESLENILKQKEIKEDHKLPIMSNDEIGDLSYTYNKIQEKLLSQQEIIEKQAQFATLGEIAGGIAHDLNSPLLSAKADVYNIKRYLESDKIQADDNIKVKLIEIVGNTEHNLENMSKTINTMRDQIRSTGDKDNQIFSVNKLINGIKILMGSYLRNSNCTLNIVSEAEIELYGQDNKLDRVVTNMIKNSIDAYNQNNFRGSIDITIKKEDNNCMIYIKDEAGGISKEIAETLFKEMKTSKDKDGTGFGLYYAYRIIGGDFKGDIIFENEEGKGTTFIIKIPLIEGGTNG